MRRVILLMMLAIMSSSVNAESGFTCEKIKDEATRKSCLDDRVNNEKAAAAVKEMEAAKKAEISSTCSLNGRSVIECTFKNSGNKQGRSCEKVVLMPRKSGDSYVPKIFMALGSQNIKSKIALKKQLVRKILAKEGKNSISTLEDADLASGILDSERMVLSDNEICSGIVESGDIRQVSTTVSFYKNSIYEICGEAGEAWSVICSFTTIPTYRESDRHD